MNIKLKVGFSLLGLTLGAGAITGGYFLFSNTNKYNEYYANPIIDNPNGLVSAYNGARQRGAELILAPGFNHQVPIENTFNVYKDEFKDTGFLLYDSNVMFNSPAALNTWSITFRTDLGSIRVGVAIAYFLNYYQDWFADQDDGKLTWATWGGLPFSSVTSYMGGIQKGIKWANEKLAGKTIHNDVSNKDFTYKPVEQLFGQAELTGGFGESDGIDTMVNIIGKRPDILIPVAGPQIWTAQNLIKDLKNAKTMLIGVDSACEDDARNLTYPWTYHGKPFGNGKVIQFSSLKRLDIAGQKALSIINNGNKIPDGADVKTYKNFITKDGKNTGFGTAAVGDIDNECVGISEAGNVFLDAAIKLAGQPDPSLDSSHSEVANMKYIGLNNKEYDYGTFNPDAGLFGLSQECVLNVDESNVKNILNKKGVVTKNKKEDSNKTKIILSQSNSILMDASFSQSCYLGLYNWYKELGIEIPKPAGVK